LIALVPSAPLSLANDPSVTTYAVIGLIWDVCSNDGGDSVIDYTIYYTIEGSVTFEVLEEGYLGTTYTTVTPLVTGTTYQFMVQARNTVGLGAYSSTVNVLLAQVPDQPTNVMTELEGDSFVVSWTAPSDGGSAITAYQILLQTSGVTIYSEDLTNCDGSTSTIVDEGYCTIPKTVFTASPYNLAWGASISA
jgi:hypothetical protein